MIRGQSSQMIRGFGDSPRHDPDTTFNASGELLMELQQAIEKERNEG